MFLYHPTHFLKVLVKSQPQRSHEGSYCWFASDVTAAMLVVKNKSISLRWEMNSILMQI